MFDETKARELMGEAAEYMESTELHELHELHEWLRANTSLPYEKYRDKVTQDLINRLFAFANSD